MGVMTPGERAEAFNRRQRERRAATCVHFNGTVHDKCKKGINYRILGDDSRPGMMLRLPCFPPSRDEGQVRATCPLFRERGMERVLQEVRESEISFARTLIARAAVIESTGGEHGVQGVIDCPACEDGQLSYSVSKINGHVWGRCSTNGCASWME